MKNNGAFRIRVTDYVASSPYNFTTIREVKSLFAERNKEGIKSQLSYMVIFPGGLIAPITGLFNAPYNEEDADKLEKKIKNTLSDNDPSLTKQDDSVKEKTISR